MADQRRNDTINCSGHYYIACCRIIRRGPGYTICKYIDNVV